MPSKRKRGAADQSQSTLESTEKPKKQKKTHQESVESNNPEKASQEPSALGDTGEKPGVSDEAVKHARRLAKKERRKLERNRGSQGKSNETNGRGEAQDSNLQSNDQTLPTHSTKAIVADESALGLKHGDVAGKKARKLAKQEKKMLEKAPGDSRVTEEEGGDEGRRTSVEQEPTKKTKRKEKRKETKVAPAEKSPEILHDGASSTLDKPGKNGSEVLPKSDEKVVSKKQKKKEKKEKKEKKHKEGQQKVGRSNKDPAWKISDPIGGHMLDIDPVFSTDEKFLLFAYDASIVVYSTLTSLQVRQLQRKKGDPISSFALSVSAPDQLYLATYSGTIEQWDWTENLKLGSWKLSSTIYFLATSKASDSTVGTDHATNGDVDGLATNNALAVKDEGARDFTARDLVYTVDKKDQGLWMLSAHRLMGEQEVAKTEVITLHKSQEQLSSFKVIEGGQVIVATSGRQLIIGTSTMPGPSNLRELSYIWRILECPEWISSIDVRMRHVGNLETQARKKSLLRDSLDVAVGGLKGAIHIYEDLLKKLFRREQAASKNGAMEDIASRKLHWHRNPVLAVRWSLDGNYIISGGQETVLVIWQLETERTQDLPHLGAPIESIVVSPMGSSYSIRLADNSAMILSTSELRPTFSIAGIQLPSGRATDSTELPFVPTVDTPYQVTNKMLDSALPACISSSPNGYLLLAVPPAVTSRQATVTARNSSYLQTFDLSGGHQISRQALTRTNITTLKMGPESNTIEEPNVTHLQISYDGQWLVSIDEWMPPKRDVAPLSFDQGRVREEQTFRREIHLKFWSWNDHHKVWELVSRVDNPHASKSGNPYDQGRVLDLAPDPSAAGFATISEDGIVKTWKPAIRRRNGLEVRNKDGKSLGTWHCKHTVALESAGPTAPSDVFGAKLAYSQDGSILVACLQSTTPCPIYTVDTYVGEVKSSQTGLYIGPLFGLGIVNKYLITLSHELCVWDLITDQRQYGIDLRSNDISTAKQLSMTHLAIDTGNGLFAVAVPKVGVDMDGATTVKSQVAVFNPTNPAPLLLTSLPNPITKLLSTTRKKAFYAIDSTAEIRTLATSPRGPSLQKALAAEGVQTSRGLGEIFSNRQSTKGIENRLGIHPGLLTSKLDSVTRDSLGHEDDVVVVSQDKLAEVFDVGPAYAMPPVTQLFEQVASLYSGRASS